MACTHLLSSLSLEIQKFDQFLSTLTTLPLGKSGLTYSTVNFTSVTFHPSGLCFVVNLVHERFIAFVVQSVRNSTFRSLLHPNLVGVPAPSNVDLCTCSPASSFGVTVLDIFTLYFSFPYIPVPYALRLELHMRLTCASRLSVSYKTIHLLSTIPLF